MKRIRHRVQTITGFNETNSPKAVSYLIIACEAFQRKKEDFIMLENEAVFDPSQVNEKKADLIIKFLSAINKRAESDGAESAISDLEAMKAGTPDEVFNTFIDPIIQLIKETRTNRAKAAKIDKEAAEKNWSNIRKLAAQRGFSIASLSAKTGIDEKTISKHMTDGAFKYTHAMKIKDALNMPWDSIEYYFFDRFKTTKTA